MPEYTLLAVVAVLVTVALERWSGTRVFARLQFWLSMAIVFAFQVVVDGWLTKLSAPIVIYNPEHHLGLRFPWDVPVEDYLFGFAMVASAIILWERAKRSREAVAVEAAGAGHHLAHERSGQERHEDDDDDGTRTRTRSSGGCTARDEHGRCRRRSTRWPTATTSWSA